jgi:hypothetical protein
VGTIEDAVGLVCWFEDQEQLRTYKTDAAVAAILGWWKGGRHHQQPRGRKTERLEPGDAARVASARRYVDKHNKAGSLFEGYSFGIKRLGGSRKVTVLYKPDHALRVDTITRGTAEQIEAAVQFANQHKSINARIIFDLEEAERRFLSENKVIEAFCVHDAVRDLYERGELTLKTRKEAFRLGIVIGLPPESE